jgi:methane/ammonia monooxygenase subunit B
MKRRVILALVVGLLVAIPTAAVASAHGERSQEAFLREDTVAFTDVTFSTTTVKQGEPLTITGTARILDTWPKTLAEPTTGFVGVTAPGPVMLMKERTVNGTNTPGSIFTKKGGVYQFNMTLVGRQPGRWHVHPVFAVEGAGTLIGPGQWITVEQGAGEFNNPITLNNGQTVNLENYMVGPLVVWQWLGLLVGLGWLLYWIVPKPTVTRLAVTSRIPLNTDGQDVGLITKKDHRMMTYFAIGTSVLLLAGWLYQQNAFPVKIPQQVVRFEPPALPEPPHFARATASGATYDPATKALLMDVEVTNDGDKPMALNRFIIGNLAFDNQSVATAGTDHVMTVDSTQPIQPGETRLVKLTLRDQALEDERLIPLDEPVLAIGGLLAFEDAGGVRNLVTIQSDLVPEFRS